jgi:hypothetical protein
MKGAESRQLVPLGRMDVEGKGGEVELEKMCEALSESGDC